jgi:putative transport protein
MHSLNNLLAENQLLLLFTVIGLGYLLGSIRILGFSLGVAAVLFVGIAVGALDTRLSLPEPIYTIGLVLFVYAVGLQSGPGYFASFKKRGFRINLVAATLIEGGAVVAIALSKVLHMSVPNIAGVFCGALTNTPALAATVEAVKSLSDGLAPGLRNLYLESPVVAYSLAYPFGVFGVILWFYVFTRLFKVDFAKEEADRLKEAGADMILSRTFRITNPALDGKTVEVALKYLPSPGFVLSRIKQGEAISVVLPETTLSIGDQIVAVGNADAIGRARILFGEECPHHLPEYVSGITYRRIFVSSRDVVGKAIEEVPLAREYAATITRLRRGDVDFVPSPDTVLELGDQIRVVSKRDNLDRITQFFGDSLKSISETDFLSVSLGIVLGVLVGLFPFPLPNGTSFKLGFAGGPLIVALVLGRLQRTGPITWGLPFNANLVLRQIGLVFFLAAIGTKAGGSFGATFMSGGLTLLAAGALITTCVVVATVIVGYKYLKLPMSAVMGMMSGMQTQPACLAYANQQAQNELPNLWYATVYPVSMVTKIILAQIIVSILLGH